MDNLKELAQVFNELEQEEKYYETLEEFEKEGEIL